MRSLLWIDCTGGLLVGTLLIALTERLSALYALPVNVIRAMGVANLAYGTFSLTLARRAVRPRSLLLLLATANIVWAVLCAILAVVFSREASYLGVAHLLFECIIVGGLGALEWRHRSELLTSA